MDAFRTLFQRDPTVAAEAPGRVNLIGEHTDYNGGFVLPTVIPQRCRVLLAPRTDKLVRAASGNMDAAFLLYRLGEERPRCSWLDYVQGVTSVLRANAHHLCGFDVRVESNVPLGSGLSSSAALDVALLRALREAFRLSLNDLELALLGQQVENRFVGAQVGVMDPMAASLGEPGMALFIDTRTLGYEHVPLPPGADLVVINSGIAHQHSAGDYNTRRAECERACALLGVRQLRDLTVADLPRLATLPTPLDRRARHVVTENSRVGEAVEAIRTGDLNRLGALFYASHESQRDDYAVSIPEIDLLVELSRQTGRAYGARLTGGGFGGSIVALTHAGTAREVAERIATSYEQQTGQQPTILVPQVGA
ncbi:MAG: galactokinase [Gemmataceae bacterium]|nr:galactokinase [Gemmataceae bacterium]